MEKQKNNHFKLKDSDLNVNLKNKKIEKYCYITSFILVVFSIILEVNQVYIFSALAPNFIKYIGVLATTAIACFITAQIILHTVSLFQKKITYKEKKDYLIGKINSRKKANEADKNLLEYISNNRLRETDRNYTQAKHDLEEVTKIEIS